MSISSPARNRRWIRRSIPRSQFSRLRRILGSMWHVTCRKECPSVAFLRRSGGVVCEVVDWEAVVIRDTRPCTKELTHTNTPTPCDGGRVESPASALNLAYSNKHLLPYTYTHSIEHLLQLSFLSSFGSPPLFRLPPFPPPPLHPQTSPPGWPFSFVKTKQSPVPPTLMASYTFTDHLSAAPFSPAFC